MKKPYKLIYNKTKQLNVTNHQISSKSVIEKKLLIKMLKQARIIIGAITLYMTYAEVAATDTIIKRVIIKDESIANYAMNGVILSFCVGGLWFILYKINGKLKYEVKQSTNQYLDSTSEITFVDIEEEVYEEQKII